MGNSKSIFSFLTKVIKDFQNLLGCVTSHYYENILDSLTRTHSQGNAQRNQMSSLNTLAWPFHFWCPGMPGKTPGSLWILWSIERILTQTSIHSFIAQSTQVCTCISITNQDVQDIRGKNQYMPPTVHQNSPREPGTVWLLSSTTCIYSSLLLSFVFFLQGIGYFRSAFPFSPRENDRAGHLVGGCCCQHPGPTIRSPAMGNF